MSLRELATGSGAGRWIACPASVALGKDIVEPEKPYAKEGERLHHETAEALRAILHGKSEAKGERSEYINICLMLIHDQCPWSYLQELGWGIEQRLPLLGSSGQLDFYFLKGKTAYLYDWKFGVGKRVDCFENMQMAFYACALKERYPHLTRVNMWICQPKIEGLFEDTPHITQWTLGYQALAAYRRMFEQALREVEEATRFQSGSHCQFCKAKGCCPAYVAYADATLEEQENLPAAVFDNLPTTDIPRIAKILAARKRVESWFDKAGEYLLGMAMKSKELEQVIKDSGFELGRKRTYRKWNTMMTEEEVAAELMKRGIEQPWESELMAITKAEKLCDLDGLTEKPEGALTLKLIK